MARHHQLLLEADLPAAQVAVAAAVNTERGSALRWAGNTVTDHGMYYSVYRAVAVLPSEDCMAWAVAPTLTVVHTEIGAVAVPAGNADEAPSAAVGRTHWSAEGSSGAVVVASGWAVDATAATSSA